MERYRGVLVGLLLLLLPGAAPAAESVRLERVDIEASDQAITVRYRFAGPYDPGQAQLLHRGDSVQVVFPGARYSMRRRWITGGGKPFQESRLDCPSRQEVRHLVRFREGWSFPEERIRLEASQPDEVQAIFFLVAPPPEEAVAAAAGPEAPTPPASAETEQDRMLQQVLAGLAAPAPSPTERAAAPAAAAGDGPAPPAPAAVPPTLGQLARELTPPGAGALQGRAPELNPLLAGTPDQASLSLLGEGSSLTWQKVLLGVGLLGVLLLLYPVSRRLKQARAGGTTLRVLDRQALSTRQQVCLVSVGERLLVLGAGEGGVRLLTELDPAEHRVAPAVPLPPVGEGAGAAGPSFLAALMARLKRPEEGREAAAPLAEPGTRTPSARPAQPGEPWLDDGEGPAARPAPARVRARRPVAIPTRKGAARPAQEAAYAPPAEGSGLRYAAIPERGEALAHPEAGSLRAAAQGNSGVVRVVGSRPGTLDVDGALVSETERRMRKLKAIGQ